MTIGARVAARRRQLGLSVAAAARKSGVSRGTWINLESGARETLPHHYAAIERALDWAPGSIDAIQAGGEPTPTPGEVATRTMPPSEFDATVAWLRTVANNPNRAASLRAWAASQIDQMIRIREEDRAEARERGESASNAS